MELPKSLGELRALADCRRCPLWERANQIVFGEGEVAAKLFIVGEQSGDQEDFQGHLFVGPAGRLLDACLREANLHREQVYVTNAVKHFKWIACGSRRLHQKPNRKEVAACQVWLDAEVQAVNPDLIVCLGATAAQAFLRPAFRLTHHRGEFLESDSGWTILATLHPSAILRALDDDSHAEMRASLIEDLKQVKLRVDSRP